MKIEFIVGISGSGKTNFLKNEIKQSFNEKTIIVVDNIKDYEGLAVELNGNAVRAKTTSDFNLFEFEPGEIKSGPLYEEYHRQFINDLAKTIVIRIFSEDKRGERSFIQSVLTELYEGVGITKKEYNPKVKNVSDYLNIDLLIELMEERNLTIASELKKNKKEFLGENDIRKFFTVAQEKEDFSFQHSFNVIGASNPFHYGIDSKDAVVFAIITKAIRKAKLSGKPILFIVDEIIFFFDKWWFKDLIMEHFENVKDVDIKITSQSLKEIQHHMPTLLEKDGQITLFKTSISDLKLLKEKYGLSDDEIDICRNLPVNNTFTIPRKNNLEVKLNTPDKKEYIEKRKFYWNFKRFLLKFTDKNAGSCERMCLAAGYSKEEINKLVEISINDGWIKKNESDGREKVCEREIGRWY